jgi:hypothetical protein
MLDLSSSGAFIRTTQDWIPLSSVTVEVDLRVIVTGARVTIKACVIRLADEGIGVEWCEPLPAEVAALLEPIAAHTRLPCGQPIAIGL